MIVEPKNYSTVVSGRSTKACYLGKEIMTGERELDMKSEPEPSIRGMAEMTVLKNTRKEAHEGAKRNRTTL